MPRLWHNANSHIWWDTGIILAGSGMGYRALLNPKYFIGIYGYYDKGESVFSLYEPDEPIRWNMGVELCGASWVN